MCSNILIEVQFFSFSRQIMILQDVFSKRNSHAHPSHHISLDKPLHLTIIIVSHAPTELCMRAKGC